MTVTVFTSGTTTSNGTGAYTKTRIPAIVKSGSTLVAFCEGRRIDADFGDIEIIASRSTDGGTTWTGTDCIRVVDNGTATVGNPTPVVNSSGHIILTYVKQDTSDGTTRKFWKTTSTDAGATWSTPVDLSALNDPSWTFCWLGPCHGVRLTRGRYAGRLVVPMGGNFSGHSHGGVLYSDDDGVTWAKGGYVDSTDSNWSLGEITVAELPSGRLIFMTRNSGFATGPDRVASYSDDGGLTWGALFDPTIVTPLAVEGSALQTALGPAPALYFGSATNTSGSNRIDLTIQRSLDGGRSWDLEEYIDPNAAYNDMVELSASTIGILYEQGVSPQYQKINFRVVTLSTIHQVGTATTTSTPGTDQTSVVVNRPTGVVAGNILLAAVTANNAAIGTLPTGWTEFQDGGAGGAIRTHLCWKLATGSEPSTYTFSFAAGRPIVATVSAWSGVDQLAPIAAVATPVTDSGGAEPRSTPDCDSTTATTHGVVMYIRSSYDNTSTTPITHTVTDTTVTEVADNGVASAANARSHAWYVDNDEFTTSGTKTGLPITAGATEENNLFQTFILRTALQGETAWAMDSAAVSIAAIGSDTGSGADTATTFQVVGKSASDTGSFADSAASPLLGATDSDSASAADDASRLVLVPGTTNDAVSAADDAVIVVQAAETALLRDNGRQAIPGIIANPERVCTIEPDPEIISVR